MSKYLKIGLPILLLGGFFAYKMTQPKGLMDIHSAATELSINASSLYEAFEADETAANATYSGKVIEVSGELSAVETDEPGQFVLNLSANNPLGQITCNLAPREAQPAASFSIGQMVTVKGVCTGYLFDVVLDNATIISQ